MASFNDGDGVWRTISGRRVFIRSGQSISNAMKASGKFKKSKRLTEEEKGARRTSKVINKLEKRDDLSEREQAWKDELKETREKLRSGMTKEERIKELESKAGGNKNEFTREELKSKYGTDNTDVINAGKEKGDRVSLKSEETTTNKKTLYWNGGSEKVGENTIKRYGDDYMALDKHGSTKGQFKTYEEAEKFIKSGFENKSTKASGNSNEKSASKNATYSWSKDEEGTTYGYKNQYGTTLNQLQIDDEAKEYRVGSFKMKNDKTTTRKDFNSKVEELENAGYKKVDYWSERKGTGSNTSNIKSEETKTDGNEKSTSDIMNEKIRSRGKTKDVDDLPKKVEIKEQGTSNRKEVSENIQAHILDYYDSPDDFIQQMDVFDNMPTKWHAGQEMAKQGFYDIYYEDQRKFLDDLKINPKGKDFSDDKVFQTYTNLIGRESAKLYDRLQKNAYKKYMKEHPLSKMTFGDFKDMKKQ